MTKALRLYKELFTGFCWTFTYCLPLFCCGVRPNPVLSARCVYVRLCFNSNRSKVLHPGYRPLMYPPGGSVTKQQLKQTKVGRLRRPPDNTQCDPPMVGACTR